MSKRLFWRTVVEVKVERRLADKRSSGSTPEKRLRRADNESGRHGLP